MADEDYLDTTEANLINKKDQKLQAEKTHR